MLITETRLDGGVDKAGEGLLVEGAAEADLTAVAAVVNAAYRGIGSRPGWTCEVALLDGPRVREETLRAKMASKPEARILVMRDGARSGVVGCVLLEPAGAR